MLFNVPQFIDIEDKIVGPLTAKQLGWLALDGVILLVFYNFLDNQAFILAAAISTVIFGALAFYRPYNQSLIQFVTSSVFFVASPRIYIWKRLPEKISPVSKSGRGKIIEKHERKKIDTRNIEDISKLLDQKPRNRR